jgi:hypothetical protein
MEKGEIKDIAPKFKSLEIKCLTSEGVGLNNRKIGMAPSEYHSGNFALGRLNFIIQGEALTIKDD